MKIPVLPSLFFGLRSFFHPRILLFVFALPIVSLIFWTTVAVFTWNPLATSLGAWLQGSFLASVWPENSWFSALLFGQGLSTVLLIVLFLPLAYITTLILTGLLIVPRVQSFLRHRIFPDVSPRRGGSTVGSVWNALRCGAIYIVLLVLSLPLWLMPGGALIAPGLLSAWLNKQVLTYDLLQDIATDDERRQLMDRQAASFWGLGLVLGALSWVPFVSFFTPVLGALSYGHLCFASLRDLRRGP